MKTRCLLLSALFWTLCHASPLLAQIHIVGYANIVAPPGYSLVSFPLAISPNNDPAAVLDNSNGDYDGWEIDVWTNNQFIGYVGDHSAGNNGWLEPDGPIYLNPGVGALIYNAGTNQSIITIVGSVTLEGTFTNTLNMGWNLVGPILPVSGGLSTNSLLAFPSISGGQLDGDQVLFLYKGSAGYGYTVYTADSLSYQPPANYGWDGPPGTEQPVVATLGQAFWYRAGWQPVQWVEGFAGSQMIAKVSHHWKPVKLLAPALAKDRHFQAALGGPAGRYLVETSQDLEVWKTVVTNSVLSANALFRDPESGAQACGFYRAWRLP
jgi:hypothetical protein